MKTTNAQITSNKDTESFLKSAATMVAPVWPLENFVAVNPYLRLSHLKFEEAGSVLEKVAGARMTLPASYYLHAIQSGKIQEQDLEYALNQSSSPIADDVPTFLEMARKDESYEPQAVVPTVADVANSVTARDWKGFIDNSFSGWAAAYFDVGQAIWNSASKGSLFQSWKFEAEVNRNADVMGLSQYRKVIQAYPSEPVAAAEKALESLGLPSQGREIYLFRLLMRVGGWSAFASRIVWDAELYGGTSDAMSELAAVLLCQEAALLEALRSRELEHAWQESREQLLPMSDASRAGGALARLLVLQNALDRAEQRRLIQLINNSERATKQTVGSDRPDVQAVFCIDVRSEVFRRHLEAASPAIRTIGFAGFFAFPLEYVPIGHDKGGAQCPVLLTPANKIKEGFQDSKTLKEAEKRRSLKHHVKNAWWSFKMGAISCFSFVGPIGLAYLPKILSDALGWTRPVPHPESESLSERLARQKGPVLTHEGDGSGATGMTVEQKVDLAFGALNAMSLTKGFAPLVMITGHGSSTVNNPHATGLDCGACGGRTGEANARVAAEVLNDAQVRDALSAKGIGIPEDTFFLACQHDTTTDEVTMFNAEQAPGFHGPAIKALRSSLQQAGRMTRAERATRLGLKSGLSARELDASVMARSKDWAQVRPEWGLAGCSAFIAAPGEAISGLDLGGRSFLHSYDWKQDNGFGVLELIMTAPMVVASWISLQYYGSSVDNHLFGSGNKTLHNVTGGVGVLEGNGGDLRVGLPWQSVHDGQDYQHEPVRLNVMIQAPLEAINSVIEKYESVAHLVDNGWLQLMAMEEGKITHRYTGKLNWESVMF